MRAVRKLLLLVGLAAGLAGGLAGLFATMQVTEVVQKTKPVSEPLSAAQLIDKGSPDNLQVELTGFAFGPPVIATYKDGEKWAWLPVEPGSRPRDPKKAGFKIFYRTRANNPAALDQVVKRTKLPALVATALSEHSPWRAPFDSALRKAYPKQEVNQTILLTEPRLTFLDFAVDLSDERLYDVGYQSLASWGSAGLLMVGFVCLYLLVRGKGSAATSHSVRDAEALRAKLRSERPDSCHQARPGHVLGGIALFGALAVLLFLIGSICTLAVLKNQVEGKPFFAVLAGFVSFGFILGAYLAVRGCQYRWRWPTDIDVCFTGIRWRQGRVQRAILWEEIEEVDHQIKLVPRANYVGGLAGAIAQMNNPQPPIRIDTLRITLQTGESYKMSPSSVTDYPKFAATVEGMWGNNAKNASCSGVAEAWAVAMGSGKC
jgi:hypothetical protein